MIPFGTSVNLKERGVKILYPEKRSCKYKVFLDTQTGIFAQIMNTKKPLNSTLSVDELYGMCIVIAKLFFKSEIAIDL